MIIPFYLSLIIGIIWTTLVITVAASKTTSTSIRVFTSITMIVTSNIGIVVLFNYIYRSILGI